MLVYSSQDNPASWLVSSHRSCTRARSATMPAHSSCFSQTSHCFPSADVVVHTTIIWHYQQCCSVLQKVLLVFTPSSFSLLYSPAPLKALAFVFRRNNKWLFVWLEKVFDCWHHLMSHCSCFHVEHFRSFVSVQTSLMFSLLKCPLLPQVSSPTLQS